MKAPNRIKWYNYLLKPVAWFLLLCGDAIGALADYFDLNSGIGFWKSLRRNRQMTDLTWKKCWKKD